MEIDFKNLTKAQEEALRVILKRLARLTDPDFWTWSDDRLASIAKDLRFDYAGLVNAGKASSRQLSFSFMREK
jgi:hypothetical protein